MTLNANQTIKTKFQISFAFRSIMCPMTLNANQTIKTKFQISFAFRSIMCLMALNENPLGYQKADF